MENIQKYMIYCNLLDEHELREVNVTVVVGVVYPEDMFLHFSRVFPG